VEVGWLWNQANHGLALTLYDLSPILLTRNTAAIWIIFPDYLNPLWGNLFIMHRVLFIAGTRPEVIKMAPVVKAALSRLDTTFVLTGQHRQMARQVLKAFELAPDTDLDIMVPGAGLAALSSRLITRFDAYLADKKPEMVVVQGDTSSAALIGLVSYYQQIPVAHVEAGLRSFDNYSPFPEEVNRKIVSTYASLNFPPTRLAKANLLQEHVSENTMVTTGNTVVDALEMLKDKVLKVIPDGKRHILVTTHRRESWSNEIHHICEALLRIVEKNPDVQITLPVHKNPIVAEQVHGVLDGQPQIRLTEPLDYLKLQETLAGSYLVMTDSGGIQEEAPSYGVPVLVLRTVTERPEAVNAGMARVVGTDMKAIVNFCQEFLDDGEVYQNASKRNNPFGDGLASQRIVHAIERYLEGRKVLMGKYGEFGG
jgi:UDP-N-acetylglucosamine 2-epimerase (non-hydrolysing)